MARESVQETRHPAASEISAHFMWNAKLVVAAASGAPIAQKEGGANLTRVDESENDLANGAANSLRDVLLIVAKRNKKANMIPLAV